MPRTLFQVRQIWPLMVLRHGSDWTRLALDVFLAVEQRSQMHWRIAGSRSEREGTMLMTNLKDL